MSNFKAFPILAGLGFVLAFGLVNCGGSDEPAGQAAAPQEKAEKQAANPSRPAKQKPAAESAAPAASVDVSELGRRELNASQSLPDSYPDDGPTYPGTEPSKVQSQGDKVAVFYGTEDSREKAASEMKGQLQAKGWSVMAAEELPTGILLQGTKGKRIVSVLIATLDEDKSDEVTMVAISVQR
jgi:hypothetical protein